MQKTFCDRCGKQALTGKYVKIPYEYEPGACCENKYDLCEACFAALQQNYTSEAPICARMLEPSPIFKEQMGKAINGLEWVVEYIQGVGGKTKDKYIKELESISGYLDRLRRGM